MSSSESESESDWSETSAVVESDADRIRRNDKSLTEVEIHDFEGDAVEVLDALKNNTVVKNAYFRTVGSVQLKQEALDKLSGLMKCNKSVEILRISLERGLLREGFFAAMATSGAWSSIQRLAIFYEDDTDIEPLSIMDAEHISSFIIQNQNLRSLSLQNTGFEIAPIVETLSRTKVQSLMIGVGDNFSLQNGGRQLATAFERCTCITELQLHFLDEVEVELEFFQILLVESIPKMLGLKKFDLATHLLDQQFDQQFFDMVGQCIGGHQGEIEELTLGISSSSSVNISIVGLTPALRRLKVIQFDRDLSSQQIGELLGIVGDCDALEEFSCNMSQSTESPGGISTDDFKAICQLLSKFPRLKRVTQEAYVEVDLRKEGRLTAFLEMVKTSKTIEQVLPFLCGNAEEEAAIEYHCRNNMIHSRIHDEGLLAANVPASAWPLILREFSDMPDVLYYLLHQKHGAMIGPSRHGCKRKQEFVDLTK